jgi:acetyl/propionyl-CoA carboxylase alpha subunit
MVGKLVTKGILREIAIRKMKAALNGLLIEGLKTNIPLHKKIMEDENFVAGNYSTKYIEEQKPQEELDTSFDYLAAYMKLAAIEAKRMGI